MHYYWSKEYLNCHYSLFSFCLNTHLVGATTPPASLVPRLLPVHGLKLHTSVAACSVFIRCQWMSNKEMLLSRFLVYVHHMMSASECSWSNIYPQNFNKGMQTLVVLTAHTECDWGIQYHLCSIYGGLWGLVVVRLLWLSGEHWRLKPEVSWFDSRQLPAFSLSSIFTSYR